MASLKLTTRPSAVISTADARSHCRIDDAFEDALIEAYVLAAQNEAEKITGRAIGESVYTLKLDEFPGVGEPILVPRPPLVSITSITYFDTDGVAQTLNVDTDVIIDANSEPARIIPTIGNSFPDTQNDRIGAVTIVFTAGSDDDIDPLLLQALRLAVAGWYENREDVVEGSVSKLPNGFDRLLSMIRFRDRDLVQFMADH